MPQAIEKLKTLLGYPPEIAGEKLREALTHRSYSVENNLSYDNQRLEFLGDAVLEIILTDHLYFRYPDADEGELTRMRSALVREPALAELARKLELGTFLMTGRGEQEAGGAERDSTLADLFEAVLGAAYLEIGYEKLRGFVIQLFTENFPNPEELLLEINPKGALQELSQGRWGEQPEYQVVAVTGPEHQPTFEVEVRLHGFVAVGRAAGRKAAESQAARQLLDYLKQQEN
ncbi:MAG: ribonuclease III [Victivallaceae bacterium]